MAFANNISEFQNQGTNSALLTTALLTERVHFFHAGEIDIKDVNIIGESVKMALDLLNSLILTY